MAGLLLCSCTMHLNNIGEYQSDELVQAHIMITFPYLLLSVAF
jgi:hypothetical protein